MNNNSLAKSFTWSFLDRICSQLISVIVSIVLARKIVPEEYAIISIALIFINIGEVFATYGFGTSLVQHRTVDDQDINAVFSINLIVDIGIYVLFYTTAPFIERIYCVNNLTSVIRVLSLRIPLAGLYSIQKAIAQRNLDFEVQFKSTFCGAVISGLLGVFLAFKGVGVWALVVQYLLNTIVCTVVLACLLKIQFRFVISIKRVAPFFKYGWKILAVSVITKIFDEIRSIIIGKKYSAVDLAFYNKGTQYPVLAVSVINSAISSVVLPSFSREQDNIERLRTLHKLTLRLSCYIVLPIITGLLIISEPLMICLLTEKWRPVIPYFRLSCLSCMVLPITECNIQAIRSIGRSDIGLKIEAPTKIIGLASIIMALVLFDSPIAIAASFFVYSVFTMIFNIYPSGIILNYGLSKQIKDIFPTVFKCIIMLVISLPVSTMIDNYFAELMVLIIVEIFVYVLLSLFCKTNEFFYLLNILKSQVNKKRREDV